MKFRIITVILFCLLLCGCSYTEPDSRYTVTAMGFDRRDGKVTAVLRVIDATKGEQGGSPATFTLTASGKNLREASEKLSESLSKKPSFGHCGLLVFSENCDVEFLNDALSLCEENRISKRARITVCNNVLPLLSYEGLATAEDFVGIIDSAGKKYGVGQHSAFFEIETALLLGEDFALPRFSLSDKVSFSGLLTFEKGQPHRNLNLKEGAEYLKNGRDNL